MRTTLAVILAFSFMAAGCSQSSRTLKTSSKPTSPFIDEYAVLDDQSAPKSVSDQVLNRKLEDVRRHYLMALNASHQKNDAVASQHFEAAISTLNDLITYPNIYAHPEFEKLSESVIQDYESQITSIDSLDPNSSFFVLRDKIFQEIDLIPVERRQYPKAEVLAAQTDTLGLQIELSDNETVQQCIDFFTSEKGRKIFTAWLERTGRYFPMYERVLSEEKVPIELKHLSMIESGLKPTAVSWAKAVGLWQFIPSTGQMYGLDINWWVDERRDPEIATHAAARYLRDLYEDLGDWHLALASYNCGPGRVKAAIAKANSRDYWTIRQYLPRETQQYVPLYIAATKIAMNPAEYGFVGINYQTPDVYDTVTVKSAYDLTTIAKVAGTTVDRIRELNPALLRDELPQSKSEYTIRVPIGTPFNFSDLLDQIPPPERPQLKWVRHKVRRGESLTSISRKYDIELDDLCSANKLSSKSRLRRGSVLRVPIKIEPAEKPDVTTIASNATPENKEVETPETQPVHIASTDASTVPAASLPKRSFPDPVAGPLDRRPTEPDQVATTQKPTTSQTAPTEKQNKPETVAQATTQKPTAQQPVAQTAPTEKQNKPEIVAQATPTTSQPIATTQKPTAQQSIAQAAPTEKPTIAETKQVEKQEKAAQATKTAPKKAHYTYHTVRRGETLIGIAGNYNVTPTDLADWNGIPSDANVLIGQKLKIRTDGEKSNETVASNETPTRESSRRRGVTTTSSRYETHKVRSGESLIAIADRYGVSVEDLKAWNPRGVNGDVILAGAKLKIYSEAPSKGDARKSSRASKSTVKTYKVRRGDTLTEIADKFGVSVADLRRSNPKVSERNLRVGQRIRINQ